MNEAECLLNCILSYMTGFPLKLDVYLGWWWRIGVRRRRDRGWGGFLRLLQWVFIYTFIRTTAAVTITAFFSLIFVFFLFLLFFLLSFTQPAELVSLLLFPLLLQLSPALLVAFFPFTDAVRFTVTVRQKGLNIKVLGSYSQCAIHAEVKMTAPEQPDLSLSEDDEGARFTGAGLGFRARGFGAGFSVNRTKHGPIVNVQLKNYEQQDSFS